MRLPLTLCVLLVGGPCDSDAAPTPVPKPALQTEPPWRDSVDALGNRIRLQQWAGAAITADLSRLSIARIHDLHRRHGALLLSGRTFDVSCSVADDGRVLGWSCRARNAGEAADGLVLREALAAAQPAFPSLPPVAFASRNVRHYVFPLSIAPLPAPEILPPTGGEEVSSTVFPGFVQRVATFVQDRYPPAALRQDAEGLAVHECRVQRDLSVICHIASFDPPENARFFEPPSRIAQLRVAETLPDGRSAIGVRFRFAMRYVIAD